MLFFQISQQIRSNTRLLLKGELFRNKDATKTTGILSLLTPPRTDFTSFISASFMNRHVSENISDAFLLCRFARPLCGI